VEKNASNSFSAIILSKSIRIGAVIKKMIMGQERPQQTDLTSGSSSLSSSGDSS